jgi:hypothetical protein
MTNNANEKTLRHARSDFVPLQGRLWRSSLLTPFSGRLRVQEHLVSGALLKRAMNPLQNHLDSLAFLLTQF